MIAESSAAARAYREDPDSPGHWFYGEFRIQALVDAHRFVVDWVAENVPAGARVLDVAAGQGALSQQLLDLGYRVEATSWDGRVRADVPVHTLDLDRPFTAKDVGGSYPVVCAVEIIEHLENPARFLRDLRSVVMDGGYAVLTTPNVESAAARLQWLVRGEPRPFSAEHVRRNRHIAMIWRAQLDYLAEQAGFEFAYRGAVGRRSGAGVRHIAKRVVQTLIARLGGGEPTGEIRVSVLRATRPAKRDGAGDFF